MDLSKAIISYLRSGLSSPDEFFVTFGSLGASYAMDYTQRKIRRGVFQMGNI